MRVMFLGYNRGHNDTFEVKRPPRVIEYVMLVLRSRSFIKHGDELEVAEPNSVIIYDKVTPHHFGAYGEPFLHDWITFDLTEEEKTELDNKGVIFNRPQKLIDVFPLSQLIKTIHQEVYSGEPSSREIANLYLRALLLKLADMPKNDRANDMGAFREKLSLIRSDIYSNPTKKRTVKELADSVNISISYFQHLYKEQFGTSPIADAVNSRIEYAKYLLSSTDHTAKTVSDELGYPSDVQFFRQFKELTGQTPNEYRKHNSHVAPKTQLNNSINYKKKG